jgi:hypothetical protein
MSAGLDNPLFLVQFSWMEQGLGTLGGGLQEEGSYTTEIRIMSARVATPGPLRNQFVDEEVLGSDPGASRQCSSEARFHVHLRNSAGLQVGGVP